MSEIKKLTGEEIIELINEKFEDKNEFVDEYYQEDTVHFLEDLGNFEIVEDEGEYEGAGEECHRVWYFKDHDVYIRLDGWYASYDGTHWEDEDFKIVKPVDRMVRFYE